LKQRFALTGRERKEINMNKENQMIAVCGLLCNKCDIFQATHNPGIAQKIADWFKKERGVDVKSEDVRCAGCRGDRKKHWSPDCWILECCVDKKGLQFCYECKEFPCEKLVQWSKTGKEYGEALNRLKQMKKG
jgi:hypothetical protein